ncbi:Benzyl alcohol O-benzoyltransferase [Glycine soja]
MAFAHDLELESSSSPLVFSVRRSEPELVAPAKPTPREIKILSEIDSQAGLRTQIPIIQFYRNDPSLAGKDPVQAIRNALAEALVFYYPFAGRIKEEGSDGKLVVDCNEEGVMFIEADADVTLDQFGDALKPPFPCFQELLYQPPGSDGITDAPIFLIQVTRLKCGGFILAIRFNHVMVDGVGLIHFTLTVAGIARGAMKEPPFQPVWSRELLFARDPPRVTFNHREYEQLTDSNDAVSTDFEQRSFFFGPTETASIRALLPRDLDQRATTFEVLTSYVWRCRTKALQIPPNEDVRMMCIVDARGKFDPPFPAGFYGSCFAFPAAVTGAGDLCEKPLEYAVQLIQKARGEVSEEYIDSVADLMASEGRPLFTVVRSCLVLDTTEAGFRNLDFGWGNALYGGMAVAGAGAFPAVNFHVPSQNAKGEEGILVLICLPSQVMKAFAKEVFTLHRLNSEMAFMAVLESDLRALSAEARRRYPAVKDGAEHAILKLRTLSSPSEIAHNDDILRIFLMACEVRTVKLSIIGLSCLQKLISHDAVSPSALTEILSTLKDHAEMVDEGVQLKTLQTISIIFQSRLHPENEDTMSQALGICLRLLENTRSSDSVRNTAAATFRQAVALIFDRVVLAESLPTGKFGFGGQLSRTNSVTGDVNRSINLSESLDHESVSGRPPVMRETLTETGKLGLRLLEDLTSLAAGGSAIWLRVNILQRTFALDILEFILSNYVAVFRTLLPYEQALRRQICSLLMTSLRTNAELEGETGEPSFRRLVLRSVAHIIRLYSSSLITECEVFLSMLLKVTFLDLPLWHRILVLEILRGFCVEARTLRILFQNFDMHPKNTNVVEGMVKALARVVSNVQVQESSEESLAAVAGMFSSKAKGIEWSLDNDASNAAVLVASEAHAITLAVEGLLGVVFTVATLTDAAIDVGELESPRCDNDPPVKWTGKTAVLCISMVDSLWLTILDALSLILSRSQGEAIVLEILKGYQAFTQACGILRAVEPLNSFLASLCKFTINFPVETEKRSSALPSPVSKRSELSVDQRDSIVLTPKNVQALRTLFNIAHRLHNVLGPSWVLVLETLAALDRAIHSPHATTQVKTISGPSPYRAAIVAHSSSRFSLFGAVLSSVPWQRLGSVKVARCSMLRWLAAAYEEVSTPVPKFTRELSTQSSDFNILSSLNSQLFESSALMHISAVKSLLSALCQLSHQCMTSSSLGPTTSQKIGSISFSVERMISILVNNVHRVEPFWDQVISHFLELADNSNPHLKNMALDALDQSISAVLGSDRFQDYKLSKSLEPSQEMEVNLDKLMSLECSIISPLKVLYFSTQSVDVRIGSLKILLHVLERYGEKLHYSWPNILEMLRYVADVSEKDLVTLGFQNLRVIMNDGLSALPTDCLQVCVDVTGAYSAQKTELNISLTAVGLLWTMTDFIAKGLLNGPFEEKEAGVGSTVKQIDSKKMEDQTRISNNVRDQASVDGVDFEKLLFSVFSLLQNLGADERPEVRNSAVRTLFQTLGTHGQKLSKSMWEDCLWNYVFPTLDRASHMVATSSKDEWQGKELGTRGGKAVHMLIHHSRNTAQKQWDETLVLVLGGIARILRLFFPFFTSLSNFWSGWESLLQFVENSILNGSKEVALAAINCLQTTVNSHSSKGNMPMPYLISVIDVYELVLRKPSSYRGNAADKVTQEILHGLGELYVQAQGLFNDVIYTQLIAIIDLAVKQAMLTNDNFEMEFGNVPPVLRTILEILPLLRPTEHISSTWPVLLREFLKYLPRQDSHLQNEDGKIDQARDSQVNYDAPNGATPISPNKIAVSPGSGSTAAIPSYIFAEKLVPVLVDLFLQAPAVEKYIIYPEIIQSLGRCMTTRRDNPDNALWRLAVEAFNRVLVHYVTKLTNGGPDSTISKPVRTRIWKEIADVYEIFLIGYCGRALPSNSISAVVLEADESLEMSILNILGDTILKLPVDTPSDILQRLVSTLDRCASRTCSLPVETVELMPPHCSRFSLTCLQKLFSLSSYSNEVNWNMTRSEVSKISITVLMTRCEYILSRFLTDENGLGDCPLPKARLEEIIYVLQELAHLVIHPDAASSLPLHPFLRTELAREKEKHDNRPHLFALLPSFCELVTSRELRIRELVQVLLRLVTKELSLEKLSLATPSATCP